MAVSKRTRYEVLRRDNHACRYCGATAPEVKLVVDHVTPVALGGSDHPDNLVAACQPCNSGKSSTSPSDTLVADVAQRAVDWAIGIAAYNQAQMADRKKRDAYVRKFQKAWGEWHVGSGDSRRPVPRPEDWKTTVWQFYGTGLPVCEVEDAVYIAASNQLVRSDATFRYMCGIVWNKVNAMHDGAKSIRESGA